MRQIWGEKQLKEVLNRCHNLEVSSNGQVEVLDVYEIIERCIRGQMEPWMSWALSSGARPSQPTAANKGRRFPVTKFQCNTQMLSHKPNRQRGHDPENKSSYCSWHGSRKIPVLVLKLFPLNQENTQRASSAQLFRISLPCRAMNVYLKQNYPTAMKLLAPSTTLLQGMHKNTLEVFWGTFQWTCH